MIYVSLSFPSTRTAKSVACGGSRVRTICTKLLKLLTRSLTSYELINRDSLQLTRRFDLRDTMASSDMSALIVQMINKVDAIISPEK